MNQGGMVFAVRSTCLVQELVVALFGHAEHPQPCWQGCGARAHAALLNMEQGKVDRLSWVRKWRAMGQAEEHPVKYLEA